MRNTLLLFCGLASCLLLSPENAFAVRVPRTAPKALKDTQDPAAVKAHEEALTNGAKPAAAPVVPAEWIEQIRQMAAQNSKREDKPIENLEVVFKKDGSLGRLLVMVARDAKRTPNDSQQNHAVCRASFEGGKEHKLKLTPQHTEEGPDLYELLSVDQLATACQELSVAQALQQAFIKNELNYALQANAIVAPDGKSWAWEISPSEEQRPNVIYALYYYPITREIHSVQLDNAKAAARLEKAAKQAGMRLKWVKDMNDR